MRFLVLFCLLISGCSSWTRETRTEEIVYQTLSLADTVQTYQIAKNPNCYSESGLNRVIGDHPSESSVILYGAARGLIHAGVTNILEDRDANIWVKRAWQAITIGIETHSVSYNWNIGLHFGSTGGC